MIRVLVALFLAVSLIVWPSATAEACSCTNSEPHERVENARHAIVGRVVQREDHPEFTGAYLYTVEVDQVVKGEFGERFQVFTAKHGAACGFEGSITQGYRSGILVSQSNDGSYSSGLCQQINADVLLNIAGLPPLNSDYEVAVLDYADGRSPDDVDPAQADQVAVDVEPLVNGRNVIGLTKQDATDPVSAESPVDLSPRSDSWIRLTLVAAAIALVLAVLALFSVRRRNSRLDASERSDVYW